MRAWPSGSSVREAVGRRRVSETSGTSTPRARKNDRLSSDTVRSTFFNLTPVGTRSDPGEKFRIALTPAPTTASTTSWADSAGTAITAMSSRSRSASRSSSRAWRIGTPLREYCPTLSRAVSKSATIVEPVVAEARVVGKRQAEVAGPHDDDLELPIEPENLAQVAAQILDVVADAAHAELAEVRQVLANLRGVEMELLGQAAGRDGVDAGGLERLERSQVDRQSRGRAARTPTRRRDARGTTVSREYCSFAFRWPFLTIGPMAQHVSAPASSEASASPAFQPYVPASQSPAEFTLKAVIFGAIFGMLFGASTVYLGLRAGLTVSASIPIAVLAISVLKRLGGSTILENNIVQTIGSAGESVAAGVVFTIPALLFLLPPRPRLLQATARSRCCAFAGGMLGVLIMVPLRRALIVKEHGALPYPEGTACADVLVAGERAAAWPRPSSWASASARLWKALLLDRPADPHRHRLHDGATARPSQRHAERRASSPEYLGVGYILGPRIAGIMVSGGVLSWLVLLPLLIDAGRS